MKRLAYLPTSSLFLVLTLTVGGCGGKVGRGGFDLAVGGGDDDAGANQGDGGSSGTCDTQHPCAMNQRCIAGGCYRDNGTCTRDNDCQNDSYCLCEGGGGSGDMGPCIDGVCIPYGAGPRGLFDPSCVGQTFSATDFKPPVVKCKWEVEDVIDTPVLADLDLDGKPEIVFTTYPSGHLVALRGKDCTELFLKNTTLNNFGQIAVADLDGDKYPEIIATDLSRHIVVFDHTGTQLAISTGTYQGGGGGSDCNGPAIVEIDGVAPPEIVVGGMVARYVKGSGITTVWSNAATPATWGTMAIAGDLDGDGVPEIVTGLQVYDGKTGASKTPAGWSVLSQSVGAYPALADFNKDGKPDILLVQSSSGAQVVSVWDWANKTFIFGPLPVSGGWGGTPTVADMDGDGVPDFAAAGPTRYEAYSMKCWPNGGAGCVGKGVMWSKTIHDNSSGGAGSSVFDFNGDGKAEVVYRDECFFRVYNGTDGKVVFISQISSGTCIENPIIGDVDGDGHADIIVPSDNVQGTGCSGTTDGDTGQVWSTAISTQGIYVLTDPMNRWQPSRAIWNQHSYHITNINDDDTVPYPEQSNWTSWNNYRQNVQGAIGMSTPGADYTGAVSISIDNGGNDCATSERLWAQICNRGTAQVNPGAPGTFYTSDPRVVGAMKICTATTKTALKPGDCEAIYCDWMKPPQGPQDLWFRANDDGVKSVVSSECDSDNDLLFLPGVNCYIPG